MKSGWGRRIPERSLVAAPMGNAAHYKWWRWWVEVQTRRRESELELCVASWSCPSGPRTHWLLCCAFRAKLMTFHTLASGSCWPNHVVQSTQLKCSVGCLWVFPNFWKDVSRFPFDHHSAKKFVWRIISDFWTLAPFGLVCWSCPGSVLLELLL